MKNKSILYKMRLKNLIYFVFLMFGSLFHGQVRISSSTANTAAPNSSAFIDASSNQEFNLTNNVGKGLLFPITKLSLFTQFNENPINVLPTNYPYYYDGFIVYNTDISGVAGVGSTEGTLCRGFWYYDNPSMSNVNNGTWRPLRPDLCLLPRFVLECVAGKVNEGTLTANTPAGVDVVTRMNYTGYNGGSFPDGPGISSTGVTGLTAILVGQSNPSVDGVIAFHISGTPSGAGTASFDISFGGKTCTFTRTVDPGAPFVTDLQCGNATFSPNTLTQGTSVTGTLTIPYTGGNAANYPAENVPPVNGLTFTRNAGTLATGNGTLTYNFSGTPSSAGSMSVHITLGDKSCNVNVIVGNNNSVVMCGSSKKWMRYNVGADPSLDPDNIVSGGAGLHGDYYQWGRNNVVATVNTSPGGIPGWNTTIAPSNAWSETTRTSNDPCPPGYHVPSSVDYYNMINNSSRSSNVSPWGNSETNFQVALQYTCGGDKLTFPIGGVRNYSNGNLSGRGFTGFYWTSTQASPGLGSNNSYIVNMTESITSNNFIGLPNGNTTGSNRTYGAFVRCISE
ncbi:hypothetical protein D1631_03525 [Chryseobacterium nematophagum]|uniref:Uncharacterized protein n=1 Tax=Chryseobacterium nematophagum TaxID=2305228 RepID=A0A3M7TDV8_9FLAO|nr:FISUMP domain-containing protein [Chryseobacterium nematophagum]RNA61067.1 hypothetical protein D1631_03525 [Chryseobacterium nematophagum]